MVGTKRLSVPLVNLKHPMLLWLLPKPRTPASLRLFLPRRPNTPTSLFFRYNTALGPPYQVLVDTNFINFSIKNKVRPSSTPNTT